MISLVKSSIYAIFSCICAKNSETVRNYDVLLSALINNYPNDKELLRITN